jgi:predicted TIM-barrel fold metal-dependent hydrolase
MSSPDVETVDERANDYHLIDTDFHLQVQVDQLLSYVENERIRRKVERHGPPNSAGSGNGFNMMYALGRNENPEEYHGVAITRDDIREVMVEMGVNEVVVQPSNFLPFPSTKYPAIKTALASAYNAYLMDEVVDADAGIYGGLLVPDWDVQAGLEELDRHGDDPAIAAAQNWCPGYHMVTTAENDPLHERLVDLDLNWVLHGQGMKGDPSSRIEEKKQTFTEMAVTSHMWWAADMIVHGVTHGLFDKFPGLNFVLNEAGILHLPAIAYEMDEYYQVAPDDVSLTARLLEMDEEYLERMPSEYVFDHFYVGTQPIHLPSRNLENRGMLAAMRASDTFVFSTDWPHSTMDIPTWVFDNPNIDEEMRNRIFHENARQILRLPS